MHTTCIHYPIQYCFFYFSELEESLLVLPFPYVIDMLKVLEVFIDSGWEIELSCRCLFFLLRYTIFYYIVINIFLLISMENNCAIYPFITYLYFIRTVLHV